MEGLHDYFNCQEPAGVSAESFVNSESLKEQYPFLRILFGIDYLNLSTDVKDGSMVLATISGDLAAENELERKFFQLFFTKMESIFRGQFEVFSKVDCYPMPGIYKINIDTRILASYSIPSHELLTNLLYILHSTDEENHKLAICLMNGYFYEITNQSLI